MHDIDTSGLSASTEDRRRVRHPVGRISMALVLALAALLGVAGTAAASEESPHMPPPFIAKFGCDPLGGGSFSYDLPVPELTYPLGPGSDGRPLSPSITGVPAVEVTANTSCAAAQVQLNIQTKVCGFFGCDWDTRRETDWIMLPESGRIEHSLQMPCRRGVHSYRVTAKIIHVELSFEDTGVPSPRFLPQLSTVEDTEQSPELKVTCT